MKSSLQHEDVCVGMWLRVVALLTRWQRGCWISYEYLGSLLRDGAMVSAVSGYVTYGQIFIVTIPTCNFPTSLPSPLPSRLVPNKRSYTSPCEGWWSDTGRNKFIRVWGKICNENNCCAPGLSLFLTRVGAWITNVDNKIPNENISHTIQFD